MTGLSAADAVDALLLTGGFPEIVQSWPRGASPAEFLRESVSNPLSPLLVAGELTVLGEFPGTTLTRAVLGTIGSGERTFSAIAAHAGGGEPLASGTLVPIIRTLTAKGVVAVDMPLSLKADTKNKRYRIGDPEAGWPQIGAVGGWWNRQNRPEIDLVGADRHPVTDSR